MKQHHDTYCAADLETAKAAAVQAIETMAEDGFQMAQITSRRDGDGFRIDVSYRRGDDE